MVTTEEEVNLYVTIRGFSFAKVYLSNLESLTRHSSWVVHCEVTSGFGTQRDGPFLTRNLSNSWRAIVIVACFISLPGGFGMPGSSRQVMTIVSCVSGATCYFYSWKLAGCAVFSDYSNIHCEWICYFYSWKLAGCAVFSDYSNIHCEWTQRDGLFFYSVGRDKHGRTHQQPWKWAGRDNQSLFKYETP